MSIFLPELFYVFPTLDLQYLTEIPLAAERTKAKALSLANRLSRIHRMDYTIMDYKEVYENIKGNRKEQTTLNRK